MIERHYCTIAPMEAGASRREPPRVAASSPRVLSIVLSAGAVVMALEILSIRILSPTFGNSVYVWGSIISVFLAALALGYALGGLLADRRPSLRALGCCLLVAGVLLTVLWFWALPLTHSLGALSGASPLGPLAASALLFGPATVLLAMVAPFVVRLTASRLDRLGSLAGRLYAVSTAGSLVGTLGCTFLLIPYFDLDAILGLLVSVTAIAALVALGPSNRGLVASALGLALVWPLSGAVRQRLLGDVIERRLTPYQTLEVVEKDGRLTLLGDGELQSSLHLASGEPALHYPRHARAALLFSTPRRALVLGLGGGSVGAVLSRALPLLEIESVEVDPAVVELAQRHFGFRAEVPDRLHVADARAFLEGTPRTWDLIFCDTYLGLSVPFHLATREFFREARRRLSSDGSLVVNVAGALERPFGRALLATVQSVFRQVYVFEVAGASNVLLVARDESKRRSRIELEQAAARLDRELEDRQRPDFATLVAGFLESTPASSDDEILEDRFAPVDRLLRHELRSRPRP